MEPGTIVLLVVIVLTIAAMVGLYFLGKKTQAKKEEQDAQMATVAQTVSSFSSKKVISLPKKSITSFKMIFFIRKVTGMLSPLNI